MPKIPDCPFCASADQVYEEYEHYWCRRCNRSFDAEDDGWVTYGDPAKQVERKELRELKAKRGESRR